MTVDKLAMMMLMQKTLQEKAYGYKFDDMTVKARVDFIKEMSIHATQEIHEMLYELPHFKPWKDYSAMTAEEEDAALVKAQEEFIDFIHFFLNMGIALKMTPDMIADMYNAKNQENYQRQVEGYTHDKSYR